MRYRLHPGARHDLRKAASFYRDQAGPILAQDLLTDFERTIELLLQHPRLGAVWLRGERRILMKRFPYALIYSVSDDEILILAVAHHSRRPGHWPDRE